jgi:VanZ family protein
MIQNARLSVSLYNILGNIALLVPFGFLLPAIYPRVRKLATVFAYSLILSLFIETLQWVYAVRIFDIDDVILNTIGGCLGFIVFSLIGKAVSRNKPDLKGNDWAEKSPIRLFVSGLCFFTLITSVAYAASYYTQTLSTSDIQRQDEKAGNKQMLTSAASDYLYILNKDESGELRLDLYIVFPLSRHIEAAWDTTPAHDESDTSILGDIFFKVSYPNLNGTEREMITKRIPYAIYGETSKGIKEVYAEYGDEKYSALINEGSFLIIIDREIPLEDLRDKIYVKTVDESGEIKTLGFDD